MHGSFPRRLHCSLTQPDYARVLAAARQAGRPPTPFFRDAALAYLDQRFATPPGLATLLARLLQETRRIGTNLNQIAARVNARGCAMSTELQQARNVVGELGATIAALRAVLDTLTPLA